MSTNVFKATFFAEERRICVQLCVCMHSRQSNLFQCLCAFPSFRILKATERSSSGCSSAHKHKEPHSEASAAAAVSHRHSDPSRTQPGVIMGTTEIHRWKQWSQEKKKKSERMKLKPAHVSRKCLPPAGSSAVIYAHQTYTGITHTAYNNILQLSKELRGQTYHV